MWFDKCIVRTEHFADTTFDAVANDRTTKSPCDHNSAPAYTLTSGRDADRQHRTVVVNPITTHSHKVCRSTQTILPFQRSARSQYKLALGALYSAALAADGQTPAASQTTALQHVAPVLGLHTLQEAVLASAWDALWLPRSFGHGLTSPSTRYLVIIFIVYCRRHETDIYELYRFGCMHVK